MIAATTHPFMGRPRLALVLLTPALLVVVVTVIVSLVTLSGLGTGESSTTEAGLARVGDDLALVIVTDDGQTASTRTTVFVWGVLVPVIALVPAGAAAWVVASRVQRTVAHADAEVKAADDERQSSLQEVVHELRTPLAVLGTNLELAAGQVDAPSGRYIEAARRAVTRMGRTVDDLSEHGRLSVEPGLKPVDLAVIAEAGVAEHVGPGQSRGVQVTLAGSGPVLVTSVDPAAVRTTLGNLLSNSVRLAPWGSQVTVDWGEHQGWGWISVSDQGPGLAPHLHARSFERGWQGSHDRDRPGGTGLGLTIARQLTEAQGGLVTLDSDEGAGSTFTVWLPVGVDAIKSDVVEADQVHPVARPWLRDAAIA
jgi:signal transduction histidine kinase